MKKIYAEEPEEKTARITKIFIVLTIGAILVMCAIRAFAVTADAKIQVNSVYPYDGNVMIWTDPDTGVEYLITGAGMTVRVDANGEPVVAEERE